MKVAGRPAQLGTVAAARRAGLAFVTDDRRGNGLVLGHTVAWNLTRSIIRAVTPHGIVAPSLERARVADAMERFDIRPRLPGARAINLSGGNQQKVVFGKELLSRPRLLLLDEPTRGVDVGAKAEIYRQLRALADTGLGVLVASSELPELLGLCDRILVMQRGAIVASFEAGVGRGDVAQGQPGRGARRMSQAAGAARPETARPSTPRKRAPLERLLRFQSLFGLILVVAGGIAFSPRRHGHILFLGTDNIANIVRSIAETGILAVGMTFVIIAAGIDLSVGAVLGLASVLTATLLVNSGWGLAATLPLVLLATTLFGLLQGVLSTRLRIQAFIVTLAGLQARAWPGPDRVGQQLHQHQLRRRAGQRAACLRDPRRTPVRRPLPGGDPGLHRSRRGRDLPAQPHPLRPLRLRDRRQRARRPPVRDSSPIDPHLGLRAERPVRRHRRHRPRRPVQLRQSQ